MGHGQGPRSLIRWSRRALTCAAVRGGRWAPAALVGLLRLLLHSSIARGAGRAGFWGKKGIWGQQPLPGSPPGHRLCCTRGGPGKQKEPPQRHPPAAGSGGTASPSRCGSGGTHGSSSFSIRDKSSGLARSQSVRGQNGDQGRGATNLGTPQPLTCTAPAHQKLVPPTAALRRVRGAQEPAGRSMGAPFGFSDAPPKTATRKSMGCVGCHCVGCRALTPMRMPRGER